MRPLIPYYGGKQRLASRIVQLLPRHIIYVEPFAGGAAVLFKKGRPPVTNNNHYREVLNDISGDLINLYRVVQDPELGPQLVSMLQGTLYSRADYKRSNVLLRSSRGTSLDRAWAYYVNIQQGFGNKLLSGWSTAVYNRNPAGTWANKIKTLPQYLDRFRAIHIEQEDALVVIKQWDSPQTLFYCDPPYPGADQGHYQGYTLDDFRSLITALDSCRGSFVLSNYDQPDIEIPEYWERFKVKSWVSTKAKRGKRATELLWRVDRSNNAAEKIKTIWQKWDDPAKWGGRSTMPKKENIIVTSADIHLNEIRAEKCNMYYAVHKSTNVSEFHKRNPWAVTHMPSGVAIASLPTKRAAVQLADRLFAEGINFERPLTEMQTDTFERVGTWISANQK